MNKHVQELSDELNGNYVASEVDVLSKIAVEISSESSSQSGDAPVSAQHDDVKQNLHIEASREDFNVNKLDDLKNKSLALSELSKKTKREKALARIKAQEEKLKKAETAKAIEEKNQKQEYRRKRREEALAESKHLHEIAQEQARQDNLLKDAVRKIEQVKQIEESRFKQQTEDKALQERRQIGKARLIAKRHANKEAKAQASKIEKEHKLQRKLALRAAKLESAHKKSFLKIDYLFLKRFLHSSLSFFSSIVMYSALVVLILLVIIHFIQLNFLIAPITKLVSKSMNEAVTIQAVKVSIFPSPSLELEGIKVGDSTVAISAKSLVIKPTWLDIYYRISSNQSLRHMPYTVNAIQIDDLTIAPEQFKLASKQMAAAVHSEYLIANQVILKNAHIRLRGVDLPPVNGLLQLNKSGQVQSALFVSGEKNLVVNIQPNTNSTLIEVKASKWRLPIASKPMFNSLFAKGSVKRGQLFFPQIEGELYGGKINASMNLGLAANSPIAGTFELLGIRLEDVFVDFKKEPLVIGKLKIRGEFLLKTGDLSAASAPEISTDFSVSNGYVNNLNFTRAMMDPSGATRSGEVTRFTSLSGKLKVQKQQYQFKELILKNKQLNARGDINMSSSDELSGEVLTTLNLKTRSFQHAFKVMGTTNNIILMH